MREDLMCELRGRIVNKDKQPAKGWVEFLPHAPMFTADGVFYAPLGARATLDDNGEFTVMLTRYDKTRIQYKTVGAAGSYMIRLNGPGPHHLKEVMAGAVKMPASPRDTLH